MSACKSIRRSQGNQTYLAGDTVEVNAREQAIIIEVDIAKLRLLDQFTIEPSLELHHIQEHLVVCSTREQDLARIQFIDRASDGPNIQRCVVRKPED